MTNDRRLNRLEIAARILAGLVANPACYKPDGWEVTCTTKEIVGESLVLAQLLLEKEDTFDDDVRRSKSNAG